MEMAVEMERLGLNEYTSGGEVPVPAPTTPKVVKQEAIASKIKPEPRSAAATPKSTPVANGASPTAAAAVKTPASPKKASPAKTPKIEDKKAASGGAAKKAAMVGNKKAATGGVRGGKVTKRGAGKTTRGRGGGARGGPMGPGQGEIEVIRKIMVDD